MIVVVPEHMVVLPGPVDRESMVGLVVRRVRDIVDCRSEYETAVHP